MNESLTASAEKFEKEMRWQEAAREYIHLLETNQTPKLHERAAWCLSRAQQYEEARNHLTILHKLQPYSHQWPYMIGYQYYCQKNWSSAVEWFEKSLELYPNYFIVKYRLAYALMQIAGEYMKLAKGEYWQAIAHLDDCHKLWKSFGQPEKQKKKDTYFDICFLHGKALMNLPKNRSAAIKLFLKALQINPSNEYAQYELAKTFYLSEMYQEARTSLPKSNQYFVLELSANIEGQLGNYDKAIHIIKELLKKRNRDYLYSLLAKIHLLNNESETAYICAKKALSLGAKNHKNHYVIAQVYYKFGLFDKSLESAKLAASMKQARYKSEFLECKQLIARIQKERPPKHADNQELIKHLQSLEKKEETGHSKMTHTGIVRQYNNKKGYGFISNKQKDIFFHISNCLYQDIHVGDKVTYCTSVTKKGSKAIKVKKQSPHSNS